MCLRNSDETHVYFMRPVGLRGPTKIGCSRTPESRVKGLECNSPFRLEIVASVLGGLALERQFHARFMHLHSHNEWFAVSPEIDDAVDDIRAGTFDFDALPPGRRTYSNVPLRLRPLNHGGEGV